MAFISNGTTILDNGAFQASLGSMVLISEQTASGSASISFTTGIDSTYPIYRFEFINIHPSSNNIRFQFNLSTDNGSNYNVTKTSTYFIAYGDEGGTDVGLGYSTGEDLAQGTGFQTLAQNCGNDNDQTTSGTLTLFNPSSSVFVKHFISRFSNYEEANRIFDCFSAGYGNTTSSINAVRFQMSSGNIDSGTIKLYGIKDS
jgi:hypothetical protein